MELEDRYFQHDVFMAEVAVRPAAVNDLPALEAADDLLIDGSERWSELQHLLMRGWGLLAEDLGDDPPSVIGYVAVVPRQFFGRDFITLLVVADTWRRRGVGTQLLNAATKQAATDVVFTSTNASNLKMRALLRREDWLISGTLDGLDDGDPEVVYFRRAQRRRA
ncbi:MAG: GNAT family N-acetyltransferase [Actinomycetia bacterium]|nr:GNAT family N-acetyltransferase [Actinomycetes bacterium]